MQSLIFAGARFHALIPSLMKVFLRVQRKLQTGYNSFEIDLIPLTFCPDSLFTRLNG